MHSRRQFITTTAAGLAAGGLIRPSLGWAAERRKGYIVEVSSEEMLKRGRPVVEVATKMVNLGLTEYTGKSKPADAWGSLFGAKDRVAIKVNCLGKPKMSTTPEVVQAIIAGLKSAGVPEEKIVIFDMFGSHLRMSRYRLSNRKGGIRTVHNKMWGYEDEWRRFDWGKIKFTHVLLKSDKVISVPVIKNHALSGVTGALKNMAFGTVINPSSHHRNNCDPGIANIYNQTPVKDKTTLIVCDGAFLQYDGGPQYNAAARIPFQRLMVCTDPVALDKILWEYIDEKRKAKRKRPLAKGRGKPVHVATAAGLGLGTDDRAKIKVVKKKA